VLCDVHVLMYPGVMPRPPRQDTRSGSVMLQMPFLPHGSVDKWAAAAARLWTAVRGVMHDVTGALAHLHNNKVVHADVKPANILVAPSLRPKDDPTTESKPNPPPVLSPPALLVRRRQPPARASSS